MHVKTAPYEYTHAAPGSQLYAALEAAEHDETAQIYVQRNTMPVREAEVSDCPQWVDKTLTGYENDLGSHRALAMLARGGDL